MIKKMLLTLGLLCGLGTTSWAVTDLGIKKVTEFAAYSLICMDSAGIDAKPDSAHVHTYLDAGTAIQFSTRSTTFPFSGIGIDTGKVYGDTTWWFSDQIQDIDGTPTPPTYELAIDVILWNSTIATHNRATVQVIADSLNEATAQAIIAGVATAYFDTLIYHGPNGLGIYIDSTAGNTNTVIGTDGTSKNPVSTFVAARTLADALGYERYYLKGKSTFNDAANDLAADHQNWEFIGLGFDIEIAFGGQRVDGARFDNVTLSGAMHASGGDVLYTDCRFGFISANFNGHALNCWLTDTIVMKNARDIEFADCQSGVTGNAAPTIDMSAGASSISMRNYSGGVRIMNGMSNDTLSIETDGQVIISANNTSLTLTLRGMLTPTDSGVTTNLTKDAVFSRADDSTIMIRLVQRATYGIDTLVIVAGTTDTLSNDTGLMAYWLSPISFVSMGQFRDTVWATDTARFDDSLHQMAGALLRQLNAVTLSAANQTQIDSLVNALRDVAMREKIWFADTATYGDSTLTLGFMLKLNDTALFVSLGDFPDTLRHHANLFKENDDPNWIENGAFEHDSVIADTAPNRWTQNAAGDWGSTITGTRPTIADGKWSYRIRTNAANDTLVLTQRLGPTGKGWYTWGITFTTSASATGWVGLSDLTIPYQSGFIDSTIIAPAQTKRQYEVPIYLDGTDTSIYFFVELDGVAGATDIEIDNINFRYVSDSGNTGPGGSVDLTDVWRNQDTVNVDSSDIGQWLINNTKGSISGSGPILFTVGATDTSGTDTLVSGVPITLRDILGNQIGVVQTTNSNGHTSWNGTLGDSLTVQILGTIHNAHLWPATLDTIVVPSSVDTFDVAHGDSILMGFDISITLPPSDSQTTVYGDIWTAASVGIKGVTITASLRGLTAIDTLNGVVIGPDIISTTTDSLGHWELPPLLRSSHLKPVQPYIFTAFKQVRVGQSRLKQTNYYFPTDPALVLPVPDSATWKLTW